MDKRRAEEFGGTEPFSRMKKDLLLELQSLQLTDRVVVIGCCNEPYNCTKKDGDAMLAAFDTHFYIPLPDYLSRQARSLLSSALPEILCSYAMQYNTSFCLMLCERHAFVGFAQRSV